LIRIERPRARLSSFTSHLQKGINMLRLFRLLLILPPLCLVSAWGAEPAPPSAAAQAPCVRHLVVRNLDGKALTLTPGEFAKLPRATVRDKLPHCDQDGVYEGVLLHEVLRAAGVQFESPADAAKSPAAMRTAYVLVEAADGYQVVFSIAEFLPRQGGRQVLLANRVNGEPLSAKAAPYQVIVPGTVGCERWIRQVTRILVQPGTSSAFAPPPGPAPAPQAAPASTPQAAPATKETPGRVYLVGTGPGDPELISVKAARLLRQADVVFCYSWMKDEIAGFVQPGAVQIASPLLMGGQYCGAKPADFEGELRDRVVRTNEELAKLQQRVKELVAAGKTVVFADNGDPLLFSPWGWIPQHLDECRPTVVPGISSFNAANAALRQGVVGLGSLLISSGTELGNADAERRLRGTLVVFTQRAKLDELLPKLQARYAADTPIAIVCDASYPAERVMRGTLGTIRDVLGGEKLPPLYLVYVGDGLAAPPCCRSWQRWPK